MSANAKGGNGPLDKEKKPYQSMSAGLEEENKQKLGRRPKLEPPLDTAEADTPCCESSI